MPTEPATKPASIADDDGESIALMEPMLLAQASPHRGPLTDLVVDLAARAAGLRRGLPQGVSAAFADLVRAMNCYYSNLIEGHDNLSEEALATFTRFFLEVCLDQVDFMERLVQPDRLRYRVLTWAGGETRAGALPHGAEAVLEAILFRGELPRGDVPAILGASKRQARRVTAALIERSALVSASHRAPLRLAFPATLAPDWLPGLFPALRNVESERAAPVRPLPT